MVKYEEIGELPRWAYSESEWKELMVQCDKIIDGRMLMALPEETEEDLYLKELLDL